jgi:hypothetical protein
MAIETPRRRFIKRRDPPDAKCARRDETELAESAPASNADIGFDASSMAAFRSFFELLDRWDQEENKDEE